MISLATHSTPNRRPLARMRPIPTDQPTDDRGGRDEIQAILRIEDLTLRNLRITQAYHDLTRRMAHFAGPRSVTWPGFATWASKTAGAFIRGEILPPPLDTLLGGVLDFKTRLRPQGKLARTLAVVRTMVSRGNYLVFEEIAPHYARLLETFPEASAPEPAKLDAFLSHFQPGPVEEGGQDRLREAFHHTYQARFEGEPKRRAERLYLANLLVGYHEQWRLQEAIEGSLNAPLAKLDGLAWKPLLGRLRGGLQRRAQEFATRALLDIRLPSGNLRLGRDVPPLDGRAYPEDLEAIRDRRLAALLEAIDRNPFSTTGSAADNWADFDDRMAFVADFFRSRHQDPSLFLAPFTEGQRSSLLNGVLPEGRL